MEFEVWGRWFVPLFEQPGRWEVYLLLTAYAAGLLLILLRWRRDFTLLRGRRLVLFLLLPLTPLLNNALIVRLQAASLLPPPYLAAEPVPPFLPLLGLLPVAVGAVWAGVGPAALIGLLAGIFRAGTTSHNLLGPFSLAYQAALAAYLLRQDYRGRLARLARQPIVALLAACFLTWPIATLSTFASVYRPGGELAALDYAWTLQRFNLGLGLLEALTHGLLLQVVFLVSRRLQPVAVARRSPPYARTLSRRFLFAVIPLFILMMVVLIYAVSQSAITMASQQAVDALARDASNGAEGLSSFLLIGQSLIKHFASDTQLLSDENALCRDHLESDVKMLPYFSRLTAYDSSGEFLCTYPEGSHRETDLTSEEEELRGVTQETGSLMITSAYRGLDGEVYLSFLSPLGDAHNSEPQGVVVGRVNLGLNPLLDNVLGGLQRTMGNGEGFVVDEEERIVAHPDPTRLMEYWAVDRSSPPLTKLMEGQGWVRQSRNSTTNARQLVCYVEVAGSPWSIVILLPHQVVLGLAINIAGPLLVLLTVLTVAIALVILLITNQLTRPLNQLARAASRIAAGNLDKPIRLAGDDEVARLGDALEKMRAGLKDRLDDLSLLLRVGHEVSATLDLTRGMPPILEGALETTDALASRVVLLSAEGEPQVVMARGESAEGIGALDRALAVRARDVDHPMLIENLSRARSLAEFKELPGEIQSAIALPVRGKGRTVAVMWVGYQEPRRFTPSEVDLLSTLANQAAVLVENARLFQMAEGGRRRLAAILSSTTDAVLVTDRDDQLLLINPAAEQALGLKASRVMNKSITEVPLEPHLASILSEPLERDSALVEEVPLPSGRTFYASASTIRSAEGENGGRVVVLRDITHFKKLDEMKSEFVATVSHDLRAPLTFMRGYASMLPMVGELTEKQQEYLGKILTGIEQMGNLVEDLLNLGRIDAGVGLEKTPCHLGALVIDAVDGMRARASAKGLVLRTEASEPAPVIPGDATLLRQAVANLVDNAIKYTPAGGTVTVGLRTTDEEALIHVRDTGIGIAPEDQVRLFEKFFRVRRAEPGGAEGTGLGLAIVRSIVERHGGRVWVESALNQGSTFTIALPIPKPVRDEYG
ncbi:MAG: ATP-binding protein [Anaerolineae bacterium]|jgi:PAS domain S-box-containing protein